MLGPASTSDLSAVGIDVSFLPHKSNIVDGKFALLTVIRGTIKVTNTEAE